MALTLSSLAYLEDRFGNPSRAHRYGAVAHQAVEFARAQVAALLGCHTTASSPAAPRRGGVVARSRGQRSDEGAHLEALDPDAVMLHAGLDLSRRKPPEHAGKPPGRRRGIAALHTH